MRIVANESAYDATAVQKVLEVAYRAFRSRNPRIERFWPTMRVQLLEHRAAGVKILAVANTNRPLDIYLPALRGEEFIGLARQQRGGDPLDPDHGGVNASLLALDVMAALFRVLGEVPRRWTSRALFDEEGMHELPFLLPLRITDELNGRI